MDVTILVSLIETTIPLGVTFNQWGVAQRGLRYIFSYKRLTVTFEVCALNGLWAGSIDIMTTLWGCGEPICRADFKYKSFEECVTDMWKISRDRIRRNAGTIKELIHFEKAMHNWFNSSSEEKVELFKEVDFYDT